MQNKAAYAVRGLCAAWDANSFGLKSTPPNSLKCIIVYVITNMRKPLTNNLETATALQDSLSTEREFAIHTFVVRVTGINHNGVNTQM
jgi:hypothetical protein